MFDRNSKTPPRIRRRDSWCKSTNITPLAVLLTRELMSQEISHHLCQDGDKPLHERINARADLYTTPYAASGWGYGKGNRAGRRLRLLWQEQKITGEVFSALAAETCGETIAHHTSGSV